jgi:hypothetical protein
MLPKAHREKGEEFWHAGAQGLTLIDEEHIRVSPLDVHLLGMLWRDSAERGSTAWCASIRILMPVIRKPR